MPYTELIEAFCSDANRPATFQGKKEERLEDSNYSSLISPKHYSTSIREENERSYFE